MQIKFYVNGEKIILNIYMSVIHQNKIFQKHLHLLCSVKYKFNFTLKKRKLLSI